MSKDLFHTPQFLELIDWHDITSSISTHLHFEINRHKLASCDAFLSPGEVEFFLLKQDILHSLPTASVRLTHQIARLSEQFAANIGQDLAKGRVPNVAQLQQFALLLEADDIWRETFEQDLEIHQRAILVAPPLYDRKLLQSVREFITPEGEINERGFSEMRQVLEELARLEAEARKRASELKRSDLYHSDSGEFDIINDRYVLPVSSDRYTATLGPIIHRSRTGQTLFVEPPQMRPYSLRRLELIAEKDWLIFKKCRELGELLAPKAAIFDLWGDFALDFDYLQALATWAKRMNLSRPNISNDLTMVLKDLVHPLIENCVPNDFTLNPESRGIILSGPNTGGKTVLLKSVAISVCLLRLGAWLPCARADIHPYSQLYFFSHDLQDIGAGLSSFSSEVKNYSALIEEVSDDALVIIDEIFNSTSSEEASALAVALLEHLEKNARAHVLLSTHHHGIKTTASTMQNYASCHMAVDGRGIPLYQVVWGSPGSSRGIETFKRLTTDTTWGKSIAARATTLLGSKVFDYESALADINAQKAEYLLKQKEADQQISLLKNEREAFTLQKETVLAKTQNELAKRYEEIVARTKNELEKFRRNESSARKTLDTLTQGKRELSPSGRTALPPDSLKDLPAKSEGTKVWSLGLGKAGTVIQDKDSKLLIDFKGLRAWCKRSDLKLLSGADQVKPNVAQISVHVNRQVIGTTRFDGRGMRLEAFQSEVMASLHELLNGEIPYLDIIHGHGDGILKKWLRKHLEREREFEWTPMDGNDGATRVQIKK